MTYVLISNNLDDQGVVFNICLLLLGAGVKMEHFQAALDPRKQELLEARFLGAKVSSTFY